MLVKVNVERMRQKLLKLFIAIGVSLVCVSVIGVMTYLIAFICNFLGKWMFVLLFVLFILLVKMLYSGLGDREEEEDSDE